MNYLLAAAVTNLSYAIADIGNGLVAKRTPAIKIALWVALFALAVFFVPMLVFFREDLARVDAVGLLLIFSTSSIGLLGYFFFVTGMERGGVMLTGVITGSFPVVSTVVALVVFGERISITQAGTVLMIVAGVALVSLEGDARSLVQDVRTSAVVFSLAAALFFGVFFAVVRIPVERVGWFLPQYAGNLMGIPIYLLIARRLGQREMLTLPRRPALVALISTLQIGGTMFYTYAITKGDTAVIAPIAGSYPAVFAVIAHFVFREKIRRVQSAGVIVTIVGIVTLSALSA